MDKKPQDFMTCHLGNTKILNLGKAEGGSLYIGGWSRGAMIADTMAVFNLSQASQSEWHKHTWYNIYIPQDCTPRWSAFFWESLAQTIYHELSQGNVLIADTTGHDQVAMFCCIISYLLKEKRYIRVYKRDMLVDNPVQWIQNVHCSESLSIISQQICVLETCQSLLDNNSFSDILQEVKTAPHIYYPSDYQAIIQEWNEDTITENIPYQCPICLQEQPTLIQAISHCNKLSLRHCPVCQTKHDLPIEAYECCML